jgi:glycosyltransferase involved in cell wall biosynthesis
VEGLLGAFAILAREDPLLTLVLVGRLSDGQQRHARATGAASRITLLRDLEARELADCYRAADCLAHLSFYEGFGYPPLEAMACGCPVVCTRAGAVAEIVGDCAERVEPDAVSAAAGLAALLGNADLQQSRRAAGLERASAFVGERGYVAALRRAWNAS